MNEVLWLTKTPVCFQDIVGRAQEHGYVHIAFLSAVTHGGDTDGGGHTQVRHGTGHHGSVRAQPQAAAAQCKTPLRIIN